MLLVAGAVGSIGKGGRGGRAMDLLPDAIHIVLHDIE